MSIIFVNEQESSVHGQALAKIVAEALLYKIRLQKETGSIKQEKSEK